MTWSLAKMLRWRGRWFSWRPKVKKRRDKSRPALEQLEDRIAPSATATPDPETRRADPPASAPSRQAETGSSRGSTIVVLTHGFQPGGRRTPSPDGWVERAAEGIEQQFRAAGADATILTVDWFSYSGTGSQAAQVAARIAQLVGQQDRPVDLLFIGHSRGAPFNTDVLQQLAQNRALTPRLDYVESITLDPTPVRDLGDLTPRPDLVPPGVDRAINYDDGVTLSPWLPVQDGFTIEGASNILFPVPNPGSTARTATLEEAVRSHTTIHNRYVDSDHFREDVRGFLTNKDPQAPAQAGSRATAPGQGAQVSNETVRTDINPFSQAQAALQSVGVRIKRTIETATQAAISKVSTAASKVVQAAKVVSDKVTQAAKAAPKSAVKVAGSVAKAAAPVAKKVAQGVSSVPSKVTQAVQTTATKVAQTVKTAASKVTETVKTVATKLAEAAKTVVAKAAPVVSKAVSSVGSAVKSAAPSKPSGGGAKSSGRR